MSFKTLFDKANAASSLSNKSAQDIGAEVESVGYHTEDMKKEARFISRVDFSKPENFARYGSAEEYYQQSLERIWETYPYDGSLKEKLQWENESTEIDLHIFDNLYPRTNGYINFSAKGWGSLQGSKRDGYGLSDGREYIYFKGGPHPSTDSTTSLSTKFTGSNYYEPDANRASNLHFDLKNKGTTVEFWLKKERFDPDSTEKEVIFDLWNGEATGSSDYGRFRIELTGATDGVGPFRVTVMSGTTGVINASVAATAFTTASVADNAWHHYALSLKTPQSTTAQKSVLFEASTSDRIDIGTSWESLIGGAGAGARPLTFSAWVYIDPDTTETVPHVLSFGYNRNFRYNLSAEKFEFLVRNTGGAYITATTTNKTSKGRWHHLVATYSGGGTYGDGVGTMKIYIDGVDETSTSTTTTSAQAVGAATGYIGGWQTTSHSNFWDGYIDEVTIWSAALAAAEVASVYNNGIPSSPTATGMPSSLLSWYQMGDNANDSLDGTTSASSTNKIVDKKGGRDGYSDNGSMAANQIVSYSAANSSLKTKFYVDGNLNKEDLFSTGLLSLDSSNINEVSGALRAYIGALITSPSASSAVQYAGKLSASLDEFRYWKAQRSSKDIGRFWFDQVGGGTNTDPEPFTDTQTSVNTNLGVYFKFNEGIVGNTSTDSVVLDYSGRVSNGAWTGYSAGSRNIGSAIVESSAATKEFKDPIIYSGHTDVVNLQNSLSISGSAYDDGNNALIYNSIPAWITEEDSGGQKHLKQLTQIMASYFDTLHLQIESLNSLKDVQYVSGSDKPLPFAAKLLDSHGFISPEIFLDADVLEKLADRSEDRLYDKSLSDIKNIIYQNIYNNLTFIYKSKGTEKSFRNLIRCFGIDDELIKLKLYAKNTDFEFRENRRILSVANKFVNFNTGLNTNATVFSFKESGNPDTTGIIPEVAALTDGFAFTLETDLFFPKKREITNPAYFNTNVISSSLFGIHGTLDAATASTDTTWPVAFLTSATATIVGNASLDDASGTSLILTNTDGSTVTFTTDPTLNFGDVTADIGDTAATATFVGTAALNGADGTNLILTNTDGSTVTFHTDPTKNFGDTSSDGGDHTWIINTRDISGGSEVRKATQAFHIACLAAIAAGELDMTAVPATNTGTQTSFTLTQTTAGTAGNTAITLITGMTANGETTFTGGTDQRWRVNTRDIGGASATRMATQALYIACKGAIDAGELDMTIDPPTVAPVASGQEYFTLTQTTAGTAGNTAISLIAGVTADGETSFTGGIDSFDPVNFQVYAVRDELKSRNVRFVLTGTAGGEVPRLESDLYEDTYNDVNWNLSVRIKPENYPLTTLKNTFNTGHYTVELHGIKAQSGEITDTFTISGSVLSASNSFITGSRRVFAGAHRTNFTGAVLQSSDVKLEACRFWLDYVEDTALRNHVLDSENHGPLQPSEYAFPFEVSGAYNDLKKADTLAFNWEFSTNTGSNASGEFVIVDETSGSATIANNRFGALGPIVGKQYSGKGYGFEASSTSPISKESVVVSRLNELETIAPAEMISVLSTEDQQVFKIDSRPVNYFFSFEKSMYNTISEEIVNYFGTLKDFNNVIGSPVERFRGRYKSMGVLRQRFFEKIKNDEIDFDKFYEFYKWFDSSLSFMLGQLVPASADFAENVRTIVESHALERNKYRNKAPFLDKESTVFETNLFSNVDYGEAVSSPDDDAQGTGFYPPQAPSRRVAGLSTAGYVDKWKYVHAPPDASQDEKYLWWKHKAEKECNTGLWGDGDIRVCESRTKIADTMASADAREKARCYRFSVAGNYSLGGVGLSFNKRPNFVFNATAPFGRVVSGTEAIENIIVAKASEVETLLDTMDEFYPSYKQRLGFQADPDINKNNSSDAKTNGTIIAPFSLYSSSVTTGYNEELGNLFKSGVTITNLHHDLVYDNTLPAQGPFTERFVGGRKHRHTPINQGSDGIYTRAEGWRIQFGGVSSSAGGTFTSSLAMVPPDSRGASSISSIPTAYKFRDETAKRPVNIKNILMTTASADTALSGVLVHGPIGNYQKNYQVVQTTGRTTNDPFFQDQSFDFARYPETLATRGLHPLVINSTANTSGNLDYQLPDRTGANSNKTVFVSRFSAPGSHEVSSRGYLDPAHEEQSVYNALPYRNRGVIDYGLSGSASIDPTETLVVTDHISKSRGLNQRHSLHCGPFGSDAAYGSVPASTYVTVPSYHKVNRNARKRMEETTTGYLTGTLYDNWFVQHAIPRSTQQYAWVTASLGAGETIFGHQAPNYVSASSLDKLISSSSDYVAGDFNGLRSLVIDPISASLHMQGFSLNTNTTAYTNSDNPTSTAMSSPDYFNILMLNRRGPYGFPTWKQIRTHHSPLARKLRDTNKLGVLLPPPKIYDSVRDSWVSGKRPAGFVDYTEQPISSRHYPVFIAIESNTLHTDLINNLAINITYGNKLDLFSNVGLENRLNLPPPDIYGGPLITVLENVLNNDYSTVINYSERIYPAEINAYKNDVRNRTTFTITNIWDDTRTTRSAGGGLNSQNSTVNSQSVWPLDPNSNFTTTAPLLNVRFDGAGELQNIYSRYDTAAANSISASALYAMRVPTGYNGADIVYGGATLWEAPTQANKNPYQTYKNWVHELRLIGKDHSIIPEFRISEHLDTYLSSTGKENFLADIEGIFDLTGSAYGNTTEEFYTTYTNADFMKYFEVVDEMIQNQRTENLKISRDKICLKASALLKFLPYKGFYPAERTLELASLFSQSYGQYISSTSSPAYRAILEPLMAPGILYNTIKSGIAVGSWLTTAPRDVTVDVSSIGCNSAITSLPEGTVNFGSGSLLSASADRSQNNYYFDRLPFEALYRPEAYLSSKVVTGSYIYDSGVGSASLSASSGGSQEFNKVIWRGSGHKQYRYAIDNFLCETMNFFMDDSMNFVSNQESNFGQQVKKGDKFALKLSIDRTLSKDSSAANRGTFEMYSRASAFGPPFVLDTGSVVTQPGAYATGYIDLTSSVLRASAYATGSIQLTSSLLQAGAYATGSVTLTSSISQSGSAAVGHIQLTASAYGGVVATGSLDWTSVATTGKFLYFTGSSGTSYQFIPSTGATMVHPSHSENNNVWYFNTGSNPNDTAAQLTNAMTASAFVLDDGAIVINAPSSAVQLTASVTGTAGNFRLFDPGIGEVTVLGMSGGVDNTHSIQKDDRWTISDGGTDGGTTSLTFALTESGGSCVGGAAGCVLLNLSNIQATATDLVNLINAQDGFNIAATLPVKSATNALITLTNGTTGSAGNVAITATTSSGGNGYQEIDGLLGGTNPTYTLADGDYFTISDGGTDGATTSQNFYLESSIGAPSYEAQLVASDASASAANLLALVNAFSGLAVTASMSAGASTSYATISFTNEYTGSAGNTDITLSVGGDSEWAVAGMSGGVDQVYSLSDGDYFTISDGGTDGTTTSQNFYLTGTVTNATYEALLVPNDASASAAKLLTLVNAFSAMAMTASMDAGASTGSAAISFTNEGTGSAGNTDITLSVASASYWSAAGMSGGLEPIYSLANNDSFTIDDGDGGGAATFTFIENSPAGASQCQLYAANASSSALALTQKINAYGAFTVTASGSAAASSTNARLILTNDNTGSAGNVAITANLSSASYYTYAGMSSGILGKTYTEYGASLAPNLPSYYYGTSSVTILTTASYDAPISIADLLSNAEFIYDRSMETSEYSTEAIGHWLAQTITESVNLTEITADSRWVIQSKFETPVLNFANASRTAAAAASTAMDTGCDTQLTSKGMWHQYGTSPDSGDGIYASITTPSLVDSPKFGRVTNPRSLATLVGFEEGVKKRIGKTRLTKKIREAVVVVPFVIEKNRRKFLSFPRARKNSITYKSALVAMDKYIFPPKFDFTKFKSVKPIIMYVFEFDMDLDQQDITDIWQNLPPGEKASKFEMKEVVVEEKALIDKIISRDKDLHWMVFKVKARATKDFEILRKLQIAGQDVDYMVPTIGEYTYNWPYDYFSLVELIKIDETVQYSTEDINMPSIEPPCPEDPQLEGSAIIPTDVPILDIVGTTTTSFDPTPTPRAGGGRNAGGTKLLPGGTKLLPGGMEVLDAQQGDIYQGPLIDPDTVPTGDISGNRSGRRQSSKISVKKKIKRK